LFSTAAAKAGREKTESDPIACRAAPFSQDLLEMGAITPWDPLLVDSNCGSKRLPSNETLKTICDDLTQKL
jgi:hypothetical protein